MINRERHAVSHEIFIEGVSHTVLLRRKGKTVWLAAGDCLEKRLTVQASSETAALGAWRRAASYRAAMAQNYIGLNRTDCLITTARAGRVKRADRRTVMRALD